MLREHVMVYSAPETSAITEMVLIALDAWGVPYTALSTWEAAIFAATAANTSAIILSQPILLADDERMVLAYLVEASDNGPIIIHLITEDTYPQIMFSPSETAIVTDKPYIPWLTHLASTLGIVITSDAEAAAEEKHSEDSESSAVQPETIEPIAMVKSPTTSTHPRLRWQQRVGGRLAPQVIRVGDLIIAVGETGVFALAGRDGNVRWRREDLRMGKNIAPIPAAVRVGDVCYIAIGDAIHALRWRDGTTIWSTSLGEPIRYPPARRGAMLFAATDAGHVVALRRRDGSKLWQTHLPTKPGPLVADRRRVYFGARDSHVYALSAADGALQWRRLIGGSVHAPPVMHGQRLYATGFHTDLYALEAASGDIIWQTDAGQGSAPTTLLDGVLYQGTTVNGKVYAVRARDGRVLWSTAVMGAISLPIVITGPTLRNVLRSRFKRRLIVMSREISILALRDGRAILTIERLQIANSSKPVLVQGLLCFGMTDGAIAALDIQERGGEEMR